ncbi:O-antigen ligase family protein [Sphingomonas sp. NPDC092331]|jgi:O-antigen ligase|nr:O-antigen ligase family protein [Pseudomonadota bacterium]
MQSAFITDLRKNYPIWVLSAFVVIAFLTGGGSRSDIASLVFLRPVAALFLIAGLWGLTREQLNGHRFLFAFAAACVLWLALQLVPLPPALWQALPGRGLAADIDKAAGISAWRPLSLVPWRTWNALFSLLVPLTALVWAVRCRPQLQPRLLLVIIALAGVSAVLGMLQFSGAPGNAFYLYRITNGASAPGLFANRNHQAALLTALFPLLAAFACVGVADRRTAAIRGGIALGIGAILVPLILLIGSRAGVLLLGLGLACALFVYRFPRAEAGDSRRAKLTTVLIAGGAIALVAISILLSRASAIQRLVDSSGRDDERWLAWQSVRELVPSYFPFGSGAGSFEDVYRIVEQNALLTRTYFNHAHNDWIEVLVTDGLPALLLLVAAAAGWTIAVFGMLRRRHQASRSEVLAQAGAAVVVMLATASTVDYPLRTPSLAVLLVIAAVWMSNATSRSISEPDVTHRQRKHRSRPV